MDAENLDAKARARMVFDFYQREREEFANLSRERTSLSLQLLVMLGALSYAFFQSDSFVLKLGSSGVIVVLGLIGLITNVSLEKEMQMHVARARAARRSLGFLQEFVEVEPESLAASRGIRQDKLYIAFMLLLMLVGLGFALALFFA